VAGWAVTSQSVRAQAMTSFSLRNWPSDSQKRELRYSKGQPKRRARSEPPITTLQKSVNIYVETYPGRHFPGCQGLRMLGPLFLSVSHWNKGKVFCRSTPNFCFNIGGFPNTKWASSPCEISSLRNQAKYAPSIIGSG